jgi:hypothetical protein
MKRVEVEFRQDEGGRWAMRVVADATPVVDWQPWYPPPAGEDPSLDELAEKLKAPQGEERVRIRVRPAVFTSSANGSAIPSGVRWVGLRIENASAFARGCTLTELTSKPRTEQNFNGRFQILGTAPWAPLLQKSLGTRCSTITGPTQITGESVLVVAGALPPATVNTIWQVANTRDVACVVWCAIDPSPSRVTHVATLEAPASDELVVDWTLRFLKALRHGLDPELAFAEAETNAPVEDRGKRWLRGATEKWTVPPSVKAPPDWRESLDRLQHEGMLRVLANALHARPSPRRIQVVITPGVAGSGLDLFRQRRIDLAHPIEPRQVAWSEGEKSQLVMVAVNLGVTYIDADRDTAVDKLARRFTESRKLTWITHEVRELVAEAPSSSPNGLRYVTFDHMEDYLVGLREVASRMETTAGRALVHVLVARTGKNREVDLRKRFKALSTRSFHVEVFPDLEPHLTELEVCFFLEAHGILEPGNAEQRARIEGVVRGADSYETLLDGLTPFVEMD